MDDFQVFTLITRAALIADEGTIDDYASVYTVDAVWSNWSGEERGLEEIQDAARGRRAAGATGPGAASRHIVTPMSIEVDGDSAKATSYFLLVADTGGSPHIRLFGRYLDSIVRTPGGWRIAARNISRD